MNVVGCVCIRRTDSDTHQYDVALLKLQEPASLDQRGNINAVCLPSKSRSLPVGSVCLAAGWGRLSMATISFRFTALLSVSASAQFAYITQCQWCFWQKKLEVLFSLHKVDLKLHWTNSVASYTMHKMEPGRSEVHDNCFMYFNHQTFVLMSLIKTLWNCLACECIQRDNIDSNLGVC